MQQITSKKNWDKDMWGPDQEAAFSRLKTALLKAPVVHQPDMDKAFHISMDTSQHRVGAVLYQVVNGEKKYVLFMSKVLKKGQRNYSATKRELLAIVYTLKRWEPFLVGTKFSVETDHKALSFLHNMKLHMVRDWARYQGPMGTFQKLLHDGYFWSDMKRDCRRASQKCKQCLRHNVGKQGFLPLQAGTTLLPLEKVHGDLVGPFLMSKGCKYILVLIDAATRFCWLQAMSEITAVGVVREMLHIFSEFGWPLTLVTDGGSNMSKAAVVNILALVGAEARVTIPGAHEQNSAVERMIWEVRQAIKKKCDKHPKEWKSFLPVIQMEINERVSKRTKSSPFSLMFVRRRGVFPGDSKEDQEVLERRNTNMLEIVYPEVAATAKRNSERVCEEVNSRRTLTIEQPPLNPTILLLAFIPHFHRSAFHI